MRGQCAGLDIEQAMFKLRCLFIDLPHGCPCFDHFAFQQFADIIDAHFANRKTAVLRQGLFQVNTGMMPEMWHRLGQAADIKHGVHMAELVTFPAIDGGRTKPDKAFRLALRARGVIRFATGRQKFRRGMWRQVNQHIFRLFQCRLRPRQKLARCRVEKANHGLETGQQIIVTVTKLLTDGHGALVDFNRCRTANHQPTGRHFAVKTHMLLQGHRAAIFRHQIAGRQAKRMAHEKRLIG